MAPSLPAVLLLVALVAGCTFERRQPPAGSSETGEVTLDETGEDPEVFLERLQDRRAEGEGALDDLLHPDLRLLRDGEEVPVSAEAGAEGTDLLALSPGSAATRVDATALGEAALFVLRYPGSVETMVASRDSLGWRLRFLHRVSVEP